MDRALKYLGFSLIELIVVMVIFVLLLSISYSWYRSWLRKVQIEQDTRAIYSAINTARTKAFSEKIVCGLKWAGANFKTMELCCDSNFDDSILDESPIRVLNLRFPFGATTPSNFIYYSRNGLAKILGTIYSIENSEAFYDCVVVNKTRVRMGKWNASNSSCELR
ncbi:MAG: prepilin-type N-terminal cleavage/methylation domain-containing protein [Deltaproteobacteria bacterium]|nr:prepilin-type N-terminal cleavage/methylation domain-containing protein [Deltaproteobacteria bacterium]MBW2068690.1 prepilin-type N-terminal cleavage/methylation domain-containing protein [Deltaproteobacteria bacterium]